jgi:Ca2+/Na+ antiporter
MFILSYFFIFIILTKVKRVDRLEIVGIAVLFVCYMYYLLLRTSGYC